MHDIFSALLRPHIKLIDIPCSFLSHIVHVSALISKYSKYYWCYFWQSSNGVISPHFSLLHASTVPPTLDFFSLWSYLLRIRTRYTIIISSSFHFSSTVIVIFVLFSLISNSSFRLFSSYSVPHKRSFCVRYWVKNYREEFLNSITQSPLGNNVPLYAGCILTILTGKY